MRTAYGFHKTLGGIRKREHEMLKHLADYRCTIQRHANRPVVGIVINALNQPKPACEKCFQQGERLGYEVKRP